MKASVIFTCLAILMVGLILVPVGPVLGEAFTWDGNSTYQYPDTPGGWDLANNWTADSGYPDSSDDDVTIADVTPAATCTYNLGSATTIDELTVTGDSPTWMKLHVRDAALTVDYQMTLGHYGELDIDQNMNVHNASGTVPIYLSGGAKVDVAANKTFFVDYLYSDASNAGLNLTTSGTFKLAVIGVDADLDNAARSLKLEGGTVKIGGESITTATQVSVISDPAGNGQATLWIHSTGFDFSDGNPLNWNMVGGDGAGEEAELDLDVNLTLPTNGILSCVGRVDMDIAANKTLSVRSLVIPDGGNDSAYVRVFTGSGAKLEVRN